MKYKVNVEKLQEFAKENNIDLDDNGTTTSFDVGDEGMEVFFNTGEDFKLGGLGQGFVYYLNEDCDFDFLETWTPLDIIIDLYEFGAIEKVDNGK